MLTIRFGMVFGNIRDGNVAETQVTEIQSAPGVISNITDIVVQTGESVILEGCSSRSTFNGNVSYIRCAGCAIVLQVTRF